MSELATIDEMIGERSPESTRRFSDTPDMRGPMPQGASRAFWGRHPHFGEASQANNKVAMPQDNT